MTDAEIIQLGSRGRPGRGSRNTPSGAARGLAPARASRLATVPEPAEKDPAEDLLDDDLADNRSRRAPAAKRAPVKKAQAARTQATKGSAKRVASAKAPTTTAPAKKAAAVKAMAKKTAGKEPTAVETPPLSTPATSPFGRPLVQSLVGDDELGAQVTDEAPTFTEAADEAPTFTEPADQASTFAEPSAGVRPDADESQHDSQEDPPRRGPAAPGFDLPGLLSELGAMAGQALEGLKSAPVEQLRSFATDPLRGALALAETLGVDWQGSVDDIVDFARSRLRGDYAVDEFGFDPEFTTKVFLPLLRPLVQSWFRVEVRGLENIPSTGSALLVSNHAGTMPLDGMVLHTVIFDELARHVRMLGADLIFSTPYSHDLARKTGTTLACQEDAERLLASDQLVAVFPEGFKGLGKPYADRYKLQRFGRGGFVSAAIRAQVPIIPVSIVGSEEIYPLISTAPALARAMGVPYFPVTPLFPWLGALGMIPLPSKWIIQFGEAITTDELSPGAADDPMIVFNVTDQVRETIQHTLYALLMQRRSAFF